MAIQVMSAKLIALRIPMLMRRYTNTGPQSWPFSTKAMLKPTKIRV